MGFIYLGRLRALFIFLNGRYLLSRIDGEDAALGPVIDGRYGPGDADAQEHIDRVTSSHVPDAGVGVLIVNRRYFASERVCNR